jgi:predicted GNAT superfamily acetyltransferase
VQEDATSGISAFAACDMFPTMSLAVPSKDTIVIRDLETIEDLRKIQPVEVEVWGMDERDAAPMTLLVAMKAAGSIFVGAFDGEALVGFAFGFPAYDSGRISIHSHMLAVLPRYRDLDLGYELKLAQRERALARGITEMTWTFDPLQSRNAHFNLAKLGCVSDRYLVDFYGRDSTSILHQNGTDRLWLTWPLDSARVRRRIAQGFTPEANRPANPATLVSLAPDCRPERGSLTEAGGSGRVLIEIPSDILSIEQKDAALAWDWRVATRWAFTELLKSGFFLAEYFRNVCGERACGAYLMIKGEMAQFTEDER